MLRSFIHRKLHQKTFNSFNLVLIGRSADVQEQRVQLSTLNVYCHVIKRLLSFLNVLNASPCSLVSGWPQESDLPHGQQGAVLRTSWDTSGVSHLKSIWTWCVQYICPWKPLTCTLSCVFPIMRGISVIWQLRLLFMIHSKWYSCFTALTQQEEASSVVLQHPEMCQSSGAAGVPVSHHTGQKRYLRIFHAHCNIFPISNGYSPWLYVVVCVQLCVESCPDRHLTLVKAKLGNKEDREYYKQYCKDGVDFAKLVSIEIIWLFTFYACLKWWNILYSHVFLHDSESSWDPEGWLVSGHADAQ